MKKIITITLLIAVSFLAFAEGIQEITTQILQEQEIITYDALVDLTNANSTSEAVSAEFDDNGNLQITYKGQEPVVIGVSGTLEGTLIVKSDNADYTLSLMNATIKGKTLPAIQLKSETTATILLPSGMENYVCDSSDNSKKGAITSSGDVVIDGDGTLTLEVFKKHGFKLDGGLTINGGNLFINGDVNAEGNMISADRFFVMNDGNLTIDAQGNVHATESKGIKVNGTESDMAGAYGYVEINGGVIDITSVGKAISAGWKLSEDAETETTADDPYPVVYINGGEIYIVTTGTPYEYSDDESLSPEGIEAKDDLFINGGYINIVSTDDSLNAGKKIAVNGGYVYAQSSDNDSIDSNGTIEINGGTLVTISSSWEQAFDCDNDMNFTYTGGTYFALGNGNNMPKGEGTSAYSIAYGNAVFSSGDSIAVLDEDGNVVMGFIVPEGSSSLGSIVFGCDTFAKDRTYSIVKGSFPDTSAFENGFTAENVQFITGSEVATFTLTDYTVSEGYIGMNIGGGADGFGGPMPDMPQGGFGGGFGMIESLFSDSDVTLPEGVVLPETMTSDEAFQVVKYLVNNFIDISSLFGGNNQNAPDGAAPGMPPDGFGGGNGQGQMPGGQMPPDSTAPQMPQETQQ